MCQRQSDMLHSCSAEELLKARGVCDTDCGLMQVGSQAGLALSLTFYQRHSTVAVTFGGEVCLQSDNISFSCQWRLVKEGIVVHGTTNAAQPRWHPAAVTSEITSDLEAWGWDFISGNFRLTIVVNIVTARESVFPFIRKSVFLNGKLAGVPRTGGGRLTLQSSVEREGQLLSSFLSSAALGDSGYAVCCPWVLGTSCS